MTSYSEEVLRKFNKGNLIGSDLSLQSKMKSSNTKVLEELKHLHEKLDELEADITVVFLPSWHRKTMLSKCPVLKKRPLQPKGYLNL